MAIVNDPERSSPAAYETDCESGVRKHFRRPPARSTVLLHPSVGLRLCRPSGFALLGTCAYFAGFVLPLSWPLPIIVLALMGGLAILFGARHRTPAWSPLTIAVLVFLASVAGSTLVSEDMGRSLRLSAALVPGLLLFVVVADHFEGLWEIRLLYLTLSVVALALAVVVLWAAWQGSGGQGLETPLVGAGSHPFGGSHKYPWPHPRYLKALISRLGMPILVVPNDLTFLAVVAPLSLALLYRTPRGGISLVAAASIVVSLCAIGVFRSRTAALTMVLGLLGTAVLVQPRQRLIRSLAGVGALLGVALLANGLLFPDSQVVDKFVHNWTLSGRTRYWSTAWAMFQEAPLLGQGPHTFGLFHRTPWPHNLYLEVLAEQGLVGLLALGSLMVCGLGAAWTVQRTATAEARLLGAGALAGLIAFWSAGAVELSLLREWVVTTLFMLLGIIRSLSASQPKGGRHGS